MEKLINVIVYPNGLNDKKRGFVKVLESTDVDAFVKERFGLKAVAILVNNFVEGFNG